MRIRELLQHELCRRSLEDFLIYDGKGMWQTAPHLHLLCRALEKVSKGEIRRLIVTMPPRHGKSEVISKKYPSWHVGNNPDDEIIVASYSLDLSRGFSRIARDTLIEHQNIFGVKIAKDNQSAESWTIEGHRGGVTAAGVGGPITGKGAKIAIIDDPVKNAEEASSEVIREKIWDWYRTTLYTRLTPDGRIVIVMTRWHEDDLVGRILQDNPSDWTIINFPAIAEQEDILGRKEGQALWPERGFDEKRLAEIKRDVGSRTWNALYQQRPTADEGNMIKRTWWQYYDKPIPIESFDELLQSWDLTFKDSDGTDFVVGQVWGRIQNRKYLIDEVRDRMDFPTTIAAIRAMSAKYPKAFLKLIEDKANGSAVISVLRRELPGIVAITPKESKLARASAVSPDIEAGNVYLPSFMPFTQDFVNECSSFPNGMHDDRVDAMSQALYRILYHTTPAQRPKIPDNLPEDLKQDLMNDPKALQHWLETHNQ